MFTSDQDFPNPIPALQSNYFPTIHTSLAPYNDHHPAPITTERPQIKLRDVNKSADRTKTGSAVSGGGAVTIIQTKAKI